MGSLESEHPPTIPILYVNGRRHILPSDAAHRSLLEYLRGIGLTGTKLGCGEGGCGACTVMISNLDLIQNRIVHRAVNACLAPLYSVEGMHVVTTEGIGNCREGLHRVQETLATAHGSQCGFCTPGFVMSMYSLLRSSEESPSLEEIEECLSGNLCRCTGYRPILDAFRVFAKSDDKAYSNDSTAAAGLITHSTSDNSFVCPSTGKPCDCNTVSTNHHCQKVNEKQLINPKPTSGEFIFPPELLTRKLQPLFLMGQPGLTWFRPLKFQDVLDWKLRYPDAKLIGGNTEVGIEVKFKNMLYPVLISTTHIPELNFVNIRDDGLEFGASITLAQLQKVLQASVKQRNEYKTSSCNALIGQLRWFAGCQIRNVATVGGNICTASPISDLNPLWIVSKAIFKISDHKGSRSVDAKDFFVGYRKVAMGKSEVLTSIFLPWTRKHEYVKEFKQAHRREDDIAIVNAGMRVLLSESGGNWIIEEASLAYGGVAPCSLSASITETFLKGKAWNESTMTNAICQLRKEIVIAENAPGGMVEFRRSLILSFFFKFFLSISYKLESEANFCHSFPESYKSAVTPYQKPYPLGSQSYQVAEHGMAVGQPLMHLSAKIQVSGEAEYTDDMSMPPNGLHAAFLLSTKPHARIIGIDDTEANSVPGFMGLFTAKDIPGANKIGPVVADEELFATDVVTCVGQVIGIVVGDTQESAKLAVLKVKVFYEELPPILSIDDALKAGSFHAGTERLMQKGNVEDCFSSAACDHTIEGEVRVGGQEHFYLEPNTSLVWTSDGGNEVFMVSSTQTPQKHQAFVAKVLGLPMSKVVCKTKRIGGGFGGKETKSAFIAAAAAVPAYLLRRPVRITLDRDIDMLISGQRHPFLGRYKVGFTSEGKVLALDLEIYNNGGNSLDLSHSVLERAIFHSDNVYAIPNVRIMGKVCYTNLASNTAFRGFGGPQGMIVAENWIEHMSHILGKQPEEIRELNFQKEGYELHYGQILELSTMEHVWQELKKSCNFEERIIESQDFNKRHRWKKRGVAMVPTKFGISFTTKLLNQAGALVQVYTDGTVLVTHGGVEMGQGLHTKTAQIAASCFGIPSSHVFISETSTDKVPNASPTAASASSDMYGAAVLDACDQIKKRMLSVSERNKHKSFAELASACHMERIDLSAHGFYATPDIGFEWSTGRGRPFNYFTFGAAFAEAEIDTLTGDFQLHRVDIVMDVGKSLNPAIDIGQIEGAFVQGLGWVALEEVKWGDGAHSWVKPGHLFTQGPGTYKLPTANDIPSDFRIMLIKDSPNPRAIHSSKAVGEPPLFLASAAFFAIKDAILAARRESGYNGFFPLDSPATPERIRMACLDDLSQQIAMPDIRPKLSI